MNTLIYDCEIIRCIPSKVKFSEFEYCKGWDDFPNMGISVIGIKINDKPPFALINHESMETRNIFESGGSKSISNFQEIIDNSDAIIGFNSRNFDDNLCRANGINIRTSYDLLEKIRKVAYGSTKWENQPKGYSYSLDAITAANGFKKSGSGSLAPQWWQLGEYQKVINYCLNDVQITYEILQLGLNGNLIDPNNGKSLRLPKIGVK
jgi:hypothetical protein